MSDDFEVVVIGSGVAAAAFVATIVEKKPTARILVLEAGPRIPLKDYALWQSYIATGSLPYDRNGDLTYPAQGGAGENQCIGDRIDLRGSRLFGFGGATTHWGGWCFRFKPEDFKLRTNTKSRGADWPITYDDLAPFYRRAEAYLGVSGKDNSVHSDTDKPPFEPFPYTLTDQLARDALIAAKWTYGNVPVARQGASQNHTTRTPCKTTGTCKYCPFGARYAAANYWDDLQHWTQCPNLEIRTQSIVTQISARQKMVTYRTYVGDPKTVTFKSVVVAAGAIESSKLLQVSDESIQKNRHLGKYFVTHPYFVFTAEVQQNPSSAQKEMDFPTLCSRHFDSEEEQKQGKFIFVNPPNAVGVSSQELTGENDLRDMIRLGWAPEKVRQAISGKSTVRLHAMLEIFGEEQNRIEPSSDGRLNRWGLQQTTVHFTHNEGYRRRVEYVFAKAKELFRAMPGAIDGTERIQQQGLRADHASGMCRMSASPEDGVVDGNLQVHGHDGVFVCSNAVFPSMSAVNPTLTLTALAIRLADYFVETRLHG